MERQQLNEKKLARLLIENSKTGQQITKQMLLNEGFQLFKSERANRLHMERLARVCYLTSVKEITRRMNQGVRVNGTQVEEFPFAVAHYRALTLVAQGHLSMKDILDHNSPYGLPTGANLSNARGSNELEVKLARLNRLYEEKNPLPLGVNYSTELAHQELLLLLGGASDTSGDEYSSPDEDNNRPRL